MTYDSEGVVGGAEQCAMLNGIAIDMVTMLRTAIGALDLEDRESVRNHLRTIQIAVDLLENALTLIDENEEEASQEAAPVVSLSAYRLTRARHS